ncbi:hypothetical protein C8R44DRAFT_984901 [Mycena epipterygia]|nr:hypothetical protein C8R44DRAFT_984901 [Mycena epipterygia]
MSTSSFDLNFQKSDHLQRGQACFNCRHRKTRCDGALPICGPCEQANRPDDCEYTNGQKRAKAEILQEHIARVERRIYELEHPQQNKPPPVELHQPYQHGPQGVSQTTPADEPPIDMVRKLIDSFLPYAFEFGFFLNSSRFRQSAMTRQPIGHPARPAPALLWVVYLWGLRLSKQPEMIAQELLFLARALKLTAQGLSSIHPQKVMHNLQAEVLLAYYFFSSGRLLEGKYHTAAAISLRLGSCVHMIRSANSPSSGPLPPPRDAVEEGERIHACWIVLVMDKTWAVVLGENHLDQQTQNYEIDMPWPLEMDDYERGRSSPTARYNGVPTSDTGMSTVAMLAKAALLWQRAEHHTRDWNPEMQQNQPSAFQNSFFSLGCLIDTFRAALVLPNQLANPTPAMMRAIVVAHSIAHMAAIKLYNTGPMHADPNARRKCVAAARAILNTIVFIPLQHFAYINPVMGTVWLGACQVLMDEIYAFRVQQRREKEGELVLLLTQALGVFSSFAGTCPLLNYQISQIQEAFHGLQSQCG